MNSTKYFSYLLVIWMIGLSSCTDLVDTFKDFQGDGEIPYAGKIDSLIVREGLHKLQFEGYMYYAGTAEELVIEWEDQQKTVSLEGYSKTDRLKVLLDNLEEKLYVFKVYTLDRDQNRSIITTLQANAHGDKFISAQMPVSYSITFTESNVVEIAWSDISKLSQVVLEYTDNKGQQQEIIVTKGNTVTSIYKFKLGSELKITTQVKPNEKGLEFIPLTPSYYDFPKELYVPEMLDRRLFKNMAMASDAAQNHGGAVNNLWDGDDETYMHTSDNIGVPCHITIDTGKADYLTQGKVTMRSMFIWCPYEFQIWRLPEVEDINAHEPTVPDDYNNKDTWEAESIAKGWVNLTDDGTTNYVFRPANNKEETFKLNNSKKVRYIRYRALKVWEREADANMITEGYGAYFCTSELYLYKDVEH